MKPSSPALFDLSPFPVLKKPEWNLRPKKRGDYRDGDLPTCSNFEVWHQTIASRLSGIAHGNQWRNFNRCGHDEIVRSCEECTNFEVFHYRCDLRFCPRCNWRRARERAEVLRAWSSKISQPKHLVTTQRNFKILTRSKIKKMLAAASKLRRRKCFQGLRGGCLSVEITNEGKGWHLHGHWLLDCDWVDISALSIQWGKLVGQEFGIVKVKDCRQRDYIHEVSKYVVSGSELAAWKGEEIWEFICATRGQRFFFAFGSLFKESASVRESLKPAHSHRICACGCDRFRFETEEAVVIKDSRRHKQKPTFTLQLSHNR
jgi:hypothetical protein